MNQIKAPFKKQVKRKNQVIVIFPYLFIHEKEGFEIEGHKFKPSYRENIDSEKDDVKTHLLNIAKLFRLGNNEGISHWTYLITSIRNRKDLEVLRAWLDKFMNVLRFSKVRDSNVSPQFCHFNYFIFIIARQQSTETEDFIYYEGILNGENSFNFNLIEGMCDNPYRPLREITPLILSVKEITDNDYFRVFCQSPILFTGTEHQKILRGIEWFNRSFSHEGRGVDQSESMLNVHTALEALLRPQDESAGIKAQMKTALLNLLGHSKELNAWFDSFWKLRNTIVHGDLKPESLMYIHPESRARKGHRRHLDIARGVFMQCLDVVLKIRSDFSLIVFEEELISNEVRINKSMSLLKKLKGQDLTRLCQTDCFADISSLQMNDLSASKKATKDLGALFLPIVKTDLQASVDANGKQALIDAIDRILACQGRKNQFRDLARLYSQLQRSYRDVYFRSVQTLPRDIHILALRGAAYHFFNFAGWRLSTSYD